MKLLVGINKIEIDTKDKLNSGEYNIHEVQFEFDNVYNGLIKKAVFSNKEHSYLVDITNGSCIIPYEVLEEKGDINIGAYGYSTDGDKLVLRYSPSPVFVHIDVGSYRDSYDNYKQPTADVVEQLTKRIEEAEEEVNETLEEVSGYSTRITNLEDNKVDKVTGKGLSTNDYTTEEQTKLSGIETGAEVNVIEDVKVNGTSQTVTNKAIDITVPTKTSDLNNDSGFIDKTVNNLNNYTLSSNLSTVATTGNYNDLSNKPTIPDVSNFITKDVNNLTYYTLKTSTGSLIDLEINSTTYVVTLSLKDVDGNVISTDTIDLPLETVVVNGRYDNNTKKVILTLENGSEIDFSVADLVAGLQTEITSQNKLASDLVDDSNSGNKFVTTSEKNTWNAKSDFSGSYNDLTNKPTIPDELADLTDDSTHRLVTDTEKTTWNSKLDTSKVKTTNSTTTGDVYDVTYINSLIGNIDSALDTINNEVIS